VLGQVDNSEQIWGRAWRDLDLRSIRCLLVLAEEGHYGRAARRLHMSQSGLSRAIVALEQSVGTRLVVRRSPPARLTVEGEILALHGRRMLLEQQIAFDALIASEVPGGTVETFARRTG
jgi:DNA-binding transcriptional LysR family regulator